MLLIAGGHETTAKLIANGIRLFGSHPEQRAAVIAAPRAHDAGRRGAAPIHQPDAVHDPHDDTRRRAPRACDPGRRRRSPCCSVPGTATLAEFERPDDFDIFRPNPRILAFGHGAHVCLGAAVARLEGRVALQEFLHRFPAYEIDEAGITYMHSGNVQGPTRMPLTVG